MANLEEPGGARWPDLLAKELRIRFSASRVSTSCFGEDLEADGLNSAVKKTRGGHTSPFVGGRRSASEDPVSCNSDPPEGVNSHERSGTEIA